MLPLDDGATPEVSPVLLVAPDMGLEPVAGAPIELVLPVAPVLPVAGVVAVSVLLDGKAGSALDVVGVGVGTTSSRLVQAPRETATASVNAA